MVNSEHNEPSLDSSAAAERVVFLGASNLTRGAGVVLDLARRRLGTPLDVLAAMGHGRAYRVRSCLFGRTLPAIVECGLWRALRDRPAASTSALVTDIGNDLMYGVAVDEIVAAVDRCLGRLAAAGSRVVMTLPPIRVLAHLSKSRYYLMRNVLFPTCRLGFDCVIGRAGKLDEKLRTLVGGDVRLIEPRLDWYGFDPIHLRRSRRREAWREILEKWPSRVPARGPDLQVRPRWREMMGLRPERRWILGIPRSHQQPARQLADHTTLSLF